jgi:transcriptional regulator with XRE-family HTH domain
METLETTGLPGLRAKLPRHGDQAALAVKLGWEPARLNRYITGRRTPDLRSVRQLARALDCSVDDLLTSENTS